MVAAQSAALPCPVPALHLLPRPSPPRPTPPHPHPAAHYCQDTTRLLFSLQRVELSSRAQLALLHAAAILLQRRRLAVLAWRQLCYLRALRRPAAVALQRFARGRITRRLIGVYATTPLLHCCCTALGSKVIAPSLVELALPLESAFLMSAPVSTPARENALTALPLDSETSLAVGLPSPLSGVRALLDQMLKFTSIDTSASCRHNVLLGSGLMAFDDI